MNRAKRDVLIIGTGIIGVSHARELSRFHDLAMTVIDESAAPAMNHGTGASSACVRRCYSSKALTLMADFGMRSLVEMQRAHSDVSLFSQVGCLTVGRPTDRFMSDQALIFQSLNFEIQSMTESELREKYPTCAFENFETGLLDPESGYASPHLVTEVLAEEARTNGVKFIFNQKVKSIIELHGRACGVRLNNGEEVKADLIICASAYGTKDLLKSIGVVLPISTSIRPIFTAFFETNKSAKVPVVSKYPASVWSIFFSNANPLGSDLNFRKAIELGIDRDSIAMIDHSTAAHELLPKQFWGRARHASMSDVTAARALLKKVPKALLAKHWEVPVFSSGPFSRIRVARLAELQKQLSSLGIAVTFYPSSEKFLSDETGAKVPMKISGRVTDFVDPLIMFASFRGKSPYKYEKPKGDPEFEALYEKADRTFERTARVAATVELSHYVIDHAFVVPLVEDPIVYYFDPAHVQDLGNQPQALTLFLDRISLKETK